MARFVFSSMICTNVFVEKENTLAYVFTVQTFAKQHLISCCFILRLFAVSLKKIYFIFLFVSVFVFAPIPHCYCVLLCSLYLWCLLREQHSKNVLCVQLYSPSFFFLSHSLFMLIRYYSTSCCMYLYHYKIYRLLAIVRSNVYAVNKRFSYYYFFASFEAQIQIFVAHLSTECKNETKYSCAYLAISI